MLEIVKYTPGSENSALEQLLGRSETASSEVEPAVRKIVERVRKGGDVALAELTLEFDGVDLTQVGFTVSKEEFAAAGDALSDDLLNAITQASENIRRFHDHQRRESWQYDDGDGVVLGKRFRPIERVGLYIPGGTAPLFSTVLMAAIPAQVAGVPEIVLCTPPSADGAINPAILFAAELCGVSRLYRVGGAQAIAAMAYGTSSIGAVDKIVGPGNAYVVAAKRLVFGQVGIEMLPGPSEIVIIADESANPVYIAADMLSQAEHGSGYEASVLITTSESVAESTCRELESQIVLLERSEMATKALERFGKVFLVDTLDDGYDLCGRLAAEHVEVMTSDPWAAVDKITHAGAIFLGPASSEPVGDYFCGTNHILPTGRAARFASSLGVDDFLINTSIIAYSQERLEKSAQQIITMAEAEGLTAHAVAIRVRSGQTP